MEELKMRQSGKGVRFNVRPWLAFVTTGLFLLTIFFYFRIFPFGASDIVGTQAGGQNASFLIRLKNQLFSGRELTYSFRIGMGKNTAGVFAYYLSSPLNLLAILFPLNKLSEAVVLLIFLKVSFAGAFMTWLLDRKFRSETKMSIMFGTIYALSSFSMAFLLNFMWLDGFALLPLLILVTEEFRKAPKKWWKLLFVFCLLFASGYYMAYIVGIFALMYIMALLVFDGAFEPKVKPSGESVTGLFFLAVLCAAMICAVVFLPSALDILKNGDLSRPKTPSLQPPFPLSAFMTVIFPGRFSTSTQSLPFIYSDLIVTVLVVLFFRNPEIPRRLKKWCAVILAMGLLSFILEPLNMFWQFFSEPTEYLYRHAFLFVFGTILIAFYSYLHRQALSTKDYIWTGAVLGVILALGEGVGNGKNSFFYVDLLFLAALLVLLRIGNANKNTADGTFFSRGASILLVLTLAVEIVSLNPVETMRKLKTEASDHDIYVTRSEEYRSLMKRLADSSEGRVENDGEMDPDPTFLLAYGDVEGMSASLSMANKKQNHFLKQLGYRPDKNYSSICHDSLILPADSILGIRYIVSGKDSLEGLSEIGSLGTRRLFENPLAAEKAFLAEESAMDFDFYALEKEEWNKDYFSFQEKWFSSLSGADASGLYHPIETSWEIRNGEPVPCDYQDLKIKPVSDKDRLNLENEDTTSKSLHAYIRTNPTAPMRIISKFRVEEEGLIHLSVPFLMQSYPFEVYCNGAKIFEEGSASDYSSIINLGSFPKGTELAVEIRTNEDLFPCFDMKISYVDVQALRYQMDLLKAGISDVKTEDGYVTFSACTEKRKLAVTSIPYEKGWQVTVDGVRAEAFAYQDAFLCFPLEAGEHQVKMEFSLPGETIGVIISAVGLLSGTAIAILLKRRYSSSESDKK